MNKTALQFPVFVLLIFLFFTACSNTPVKPVKNKSTLNLESAIIYKVGGVQPIARVKFYLLDKSAEEILKSANLKPQSEQLDRIQKIAEKQGKNLDTLKYVDWLSFALDNPKQYADYFTNLTSELEKHTVKTVTTDLQGKAKIEELEPKNYYIFGMTETRSGNAIWDLPIEILCTGQKQS